MIRFRICIVLFLIAFKGFSQVPDKVEVLGAKTFEYDQKKSGKVKKLIGDVKLKQGNTLLFCDSAYQYEETNFVEAFGHVHINTNDTTHIYGDILKYDGNAQKARVEKNVRMNDNSMRLEANEIDYDIPLAKAYYSTGGKISNSNSVLTSRYGYYNTRDKIFFFKKDVVLITENYIIKSDTLKQNTNTNITYFLGPTTITNKVDTIYCKNGWYDNNKDLAMFSNNAKITNEQRILYADSLFYNRRIQYGKGYRNIKLIDKINIIEIRGDFGEFFGTSKRSYVTQRAFAKKMLQQDSMYLLADTIFSFQKDSITGQKQVVKAYHNAQILKYDLQSTADSLVYNYEDSTITLFDVPILWSGQNQITADTILLFINNNKLDSFHLLSNAFLISKETAKDYNQVKGKFMNGFFEQSKFKYMHVYGNGQSIFYAKNDKDSAYIGVNIINCSEMEFHFNDNKISRCNFITSPEATFHPIGFLKPEELRLKGFKWLPQRRPTLKSIQKYFVKK